jgi:hypothetical protein
MSGRALSLKCGIGSRSRRSHPVALWQVAASRSRGSPLPLLGVFFSAKQILFSMSRSRLMELLGIPPANPAPEYIGTVASMRLLLVFKKRARRRAQHHPAARVGTRFRPDPAKYRKEKTYTKVSSRLRISVTRTTTRITAS